MKVIADSVPQLTKYNQIYRLYELSEKYDSLYAKCYKRAINLIKEIKQVANEDHLHKNWTELSDDSVLISNNLALYPYNDGWNQECVRIIENGDPIFYMPLLSSKTAKLNMGKIAKTIQNFVKHEPFSMFIHESYHMLQNKGDELDDDVTIEQLLENKEETNATIMELLYCLDQGYTDQQTVNIIPIMQNDINNLKKFLDGVIKENN